MWNRKRIGFTGAAIVVATVLLVVLVEILSADGIDAATATTCVAFVAITLAAMIVGLGEAAATEEARRARAELPQTWSARSPEDEQCDLDGAKNLFVFCQTHRLRLCWQCYMRHDPYERCDVRPIVEARQPREVRA